MHRDGSEILPNSLGTSCPFLASLLAHISFHQKLKSIWSVTAPLQWRGAGLWFVWNWHLRIPQLLFFTGFYHYHLHIPISHMLGGRVQERQSLSSSLIPPPFLPWCQSPPPALLPDTNSLQAALAKLQPKSFDSPKWLPSTAKPWSGTTALAEQNLGRVRGRGRKGGLGNPKRHSF